MNLANHSRIAFFAILVLAAALPIAATIALQTGLTYPCPFRVLVGIPCPTCGMTRSLAALGSFHFIEALRFSPLLIIGGACGLLVAAWHRKFVWIGRLALPFLIGISLANWIYLIAFLP